VAHGIGQVELNENVLVHNNLELHAHELLGTYSMFHVNVLLPPVPQELFNLMQSSELLVPPNGLGRVNSIVKTLPDTFMEDGVHELVPLTKVISAGLPV